MDIESGIWVAIDPSLTRCGYCVFLPHQRKIWGAETFKPNGDKHQSIVQNFRRLFLKYKPAKVVVEFPFKDGLKPILFHSKDNRNAGIGTALNVGKGGITSGIVYGLAEGMNIPTMQIHTSEWNPSRKSKKGGVIKQDMVRRYGFPDNKPLDFFDAVAIADYCITTYWLERSRSW